MFHTNMQSAASPGLVHSLRRGLLIGVLIALGLVLAGRLLAPATRFLSTAAGLAILLTYGVLAASCSARVHRRSLDILQLGTVFGLAAGAVFASEIILE